MYVLSLELTFQGEEGKEEPLLVLEVEEQVYILALQWFEISFEVKSSELSLFFLSFAFWDHFRVFGSKV